MKYKQKTRKGFTVMQREAATEIGAEIMTRELSLLQHNLYFSVVSFHERRCKVTEETEDVVVEVIG